ncbi:MAG TPA: DUF2167 domain-containing protein [Steroidobacteraceae bacterium]|nr:DUF2167 domain-containing protein [Steroidobacteraceae bacterium]
MRTTITTTSLVLGAFWMMSALAVAQDTPASSDGPETAAASEQEPQGPDFNYQTGNIQLPNGKATLHLGDRYRYLDAGETNKLLTAWGNPPDDSTQGAIVARDVDPMSQEGWAVILTYLDEGHVDDSDAAKMDYEDILDDMKENTKAGNEERKKAGYGGLELIGWAEAPHYDSAAKKLYWAKELKFEGSEGNTLNYDVRVLGREGILSMLAVAGMNQLPQVREDMKPLIEVAEFNEGYRYADFNSKTDRMAEYGLGALILGGIAAKTGLLAKIGIWLLAMKKFILMGLVALGAFFKKLFGKKDANA